MGKGTGRPRRDPPGLHRPRDGDLHHFQHRRLHAAHPVPPHRGQRVEKHDPLQPRLETFRQECSTAGLERFPGILLGCVDGRQHGGEPLDLAREHGLKQPLLALEVVVHGAFGDAGLRCHRVQ